MATSPAGNEESLRRARRTARSTSAERSSRIDSRVTLGRAGSGMAAPNTPRPSFTPPSACGDALCERSPDPLGGPK